MSGSGLIDLSHFVLISLAKMKALEVAAVSGLGPLNALNIISLVFFTIWSHFNPYHKGDGILELEGI